MTFPERSRAEAFATALLDAEDGAAPDPFGSDLARLVTLARALPVPEISMAPDVRDRMRGRLVAMAAVSATAPPDAARTARAGERRSPGHWLRQRRTLAAAGMIAVLLLILGVGSAARNALPGDPLYRVKTATESIRLATTSGKIARGERHLSMASERLTEVQQLLARDKTSLRGLGLSSGLGSGPGSGTGSAPRPGMPLAAGAPGGDATPARVWTALGEMSDHTVAGTKDLTEAWKESGSAGPLNTLATYARTKFPVLQRTIASLPRDDQRAAGRSLNVLVLVADRAATLQSLGGRCDADCRTGHPNHGKLTIAVDALGAVDCRAGCNPAGSISELAVPTPPAGTPAAALQTALTAWEGSLPSVADSNPTPAALMSLPAVPAAPSPSPSATTPTTPGNPTAPQSPDSPTPATTPPVQPTTPTPDQPGPGPTSPDRTAPSPTGPPTPTPALTPTPMPSDLPSASDSPSSVSTSSDAIASDTASPSDTTSASAAGGPASAGLSQSPSPDPTGMGKPSPSTPPATSSPPS